MARRGDVVISRRPAEDTYDIAVVPAPPQISCVHHGQAVTRACALARQLGVDAWLTEDHTHFLRLVRHRPASQKPAEKLPSGRTARRPR